MEDSLWLPPGDQRSEDATVRLFEEANGRPSTPAARRHLKRLADAFAGTAHDAGATPWEIVGSAIDEAVASGSAFVAPKRIREILVRWQRDGVPAMYANEAPADAGVATGERFPVTRGAAPGHRSVRTVDLPNGRDAAEVWGAACQMLTGTVPARDLAALRERVAIVGYDAGEVWIEAGNAESAQMLTDRWQGDVQRKLGVVLRRPVRIVVTVAGPDEPGPGPEPAPRPRRSASTAPSRIAPPPAPRAVPVFRVPECGMTSEQVWSAVLDDLRGSGAIPRGEVDTWLRDLMLIGRGGEDDTLVVGVPHALAERRALRFLSAIEQATMHIVGFDCAIAIVRTQTWLAGQDAGTGTAG